MSDHQPKRVMTPADYAVVHILNRINEDPDTRWSLGWGTESFRLLCLAFADLVSVPSEIIEHEERARQARGMSAAELVRRLLDSGSDEVRHAVAKARGAS